MLRDRMNRGEAMASRIAVLAAVALQLGCYNYAPLRRSELVPATYLAVVLTETESEELAPYIGPNILRSEEHTSELQSQSNLVCRLLLEKKKINETDKHASIFRPLQVEL